MNTDILTIHRITALSVNQLVAGQLPSLAPLWEVEVRVENYSTHYGAFYVQGHVAVELTTDGLISRLDEPGQAEEWLTEALREHVTELDSATRVELFAALKSQAFQAVRNHPTYIDSLTLKLVQGQIDGPV